MRIKFFIILWLAGLLMLIEAMILNEAKCHGTYSWIEQFRSNGTVIRNIATGEDWLEPPGGGCCGKNDAILIPTDAANSLRVGDDYRVTLAGVPISIKVTKIYQTRDEHGRAWITTHGCLFRQSQVKRDGENIHKASWKERGDDGNF